MNDVGNWEGGGGVKIWSKLRLVLKNCRYGRRVCQKSGENADVVYGWSLMAKDRKHKSDSAKDLK